MFQLIIAIISVLVVAILAICGYFFLGDSFTNNSDKALYAKSMNGESQIEAALNLHLASHGVYPTGTSQQILDNLVAEQYLASIPEGSWAIGDNQITKSIESENQCKAINRVAGKDVSTVPCPACDDAAYDDYPACTQAATP
jgi:hypothetical protein